MPASPASSSARRAISVGVSMLAGSLAISRAMFTACARITPRSTPRLSASTLPASNSTSVILSMFFSSSFGRLWRLKR